MYAFIAVNKIQIICKALQSSQLSFHYYRIEICGLYFDIIKKSFLWISLRTTMSLVILAMDHQRLPYESKNCPKWKSQHPQGGCQSLLYKYKILPHIYYKKQLFSASKYVFSFYQTKGRIKFKSAFKPTNKPRHQ